MEQACRLLGVLPEGTERARKWGTFLFTDEFAPTDLMYNSEWVDHLKKRGLAKIGNEIAALLCDGREYRIAMKPITYEFCGRTFKRLAELRAANKNHFDVRGHDVQCRPAIRMEIVVSVKLADAMKADVGEVADLSPFGKIPGYRLIIPLIDAELEIFELQFDPKTGRRTA